MNNVVSLIFAPLIILSLKFYALDDIALIIVLLSLTWLIFVFYRDGVNIELITPAIYFTFALLTFFIESFETIKIVPALISVSFFILFLSAVLEKRGLILYFANRYYKKEIPKEVQQFLAKSDYYWAAVTLVNTLVHLYIFFYADREVWAFYSSIGWYGLFGSALAGNILYGKLFVEKVSL